MNKHNPKIHHRRSIRLKGYDYSQLGLITICCKDHFSYFGDVVDLEMKLNAAGKNANDCWLEDSKTFTQFYSGSIGYNAKSYSWNN